MTSTLSHEPQAQRTPQSFGAYRIAMELSADALARTFLACRTAPGGKPQQVRLSVMHADLVDNEAHVQRFLDEARLAVAVQHPTMGVVVDAGRADGVPFAAYSYVGGQSLAQFLATLRTQPRLIPRTPVFACQILRDVCAGLHVIHQGLAASGLEGTALPSGLSTHSLLITYDGNVRIAGFGGRSWGLPGVPPGPTVLDSDYPYRAPERVLGHEADRRADMWSLGVMLFEAITGIQPFVRAARHQIDRAIISDPLPVLKLDDAPLLGEIVDACLRRRASDRPEDAAQMGETLAQYLTSTGNTAVTAELANAMEQLFGDVAERERAQSRTLAIAEASAYLYSTHGRGENVAVGGAASAAVALGHDTSTTDLWARPTANPAANSALGSDASAPSHTTSQSVGVPAEDSAATEVTKIPGQRSLRPVLVVVGVLCVFGWLISSIASPDEPSTAVAPELTKPSPPTPEHVDAPLSPIVREPSAAMPTPSEPPAIADAPQGEPAAPAKAEPAAPAALEVPAVEAPAVAPEIPAPGDESASAAPAEGPGAAPGRDAHPPSRADARKQRKQGRQTPAPAEPAAPAAPAATKATPAASASPAASAARRPARSGARGEPGTVVLGAVDGWAEVYFEGARLGTTPLRTDLPSGNLTLEVRAYGTGAPRKVPVVVKAGEVTKVRIPL